MTKGKSKGKWVNLLPAERYIYVICAGCGEDFTHDQGPEYDGFQYLKQVHAKVIQCPLCFTKMRVNPDEYIYGLVRN